MVVVRKALVILALFIWLLTPELVGASETPDRQLARDLRSPKLTIVGADGNDLRELMTAVRTFERLSLHVPKMDVIFSDDRAECGGNLGIFRPSMDRWMMRICTDGQAVLLHELAHAWVFANVDTDTKQAYMDLRGFEVWATHDVPGSQRGTEDAATVMQQILTIGFGPLRTSEWDERGAGFELLTGICACDVPRT